ncbi:alternate-type signal peptide domain-containing protein [Nocardioides sp. DS6]|uniref:Alternate-type signal peptide domain-containing protein n=1 Tax=Nocardioides eburneus TaxID=3231482 RepID=A0ABV3T0I1_9ACTN
MAAASAAVLLLGGAGSLAFWTDNGTASGGDVTTGSLSLSEGTCDEGWTYASGDDAGSAVTTIVPGDSVTKDCTFTVSGSGDHLSATVDAPSDVTYTTSGGSPTTMNLTASGTYDVGGTTIADGGTFAVSDGQTLTAHLVVTFPYGDADAVNASDTQGITAALNEITVTLTQAQGADNPN